MTTVSPSYSTNPLKFKVDSIVTKKLNLDKEFLRVIGLISPLMEDVEMDKFAERKLSRILEKKQVDLRNEYLAELDKMNKTVQGVNFTVQKMNGKFCDLTYRVEKIKRTNTHLLHETRRLQDLKKTLEYRKTAIETFLNNYSLTSAEEEALKCETRDFRLTADFFAALQRVKDIHESTKDFLREGKGGNHVAAVEVMDSMQRKIKEAFSTMLEKLAREFRLLNSDYFNSKNVIGQSFQCLQDHPIMFQISLEEYAAIRGQNALRQYIEALTKTNNGKGIPIEMMSHDRMRYVGDMLAFMLGVTGTERDLLENLLSQCDSEVFAANSAPVLNNVTRAFCGPFKVRVEQALGTDSDSILMFRLANLFSFYSEKFCFVIGENSELAKTLRDLHATSMAMFYAGLNSTVQKLLLKTSLPDYDLLPVPAVFQCLMLLKDVMETINGCMGTFNETKEDLKKIFELILDPLTRQVQVTATQLHSPLDVAVYTLNCLSAMKLTVAACEYSEKRLEIIDAMIDGNEDLLVSEEVSEILKQTKLVSIYQKVAAHRNEQGPLFPLLVWTNRRYPDSLISQKSTASVSENRFERKVSKSF
ncbi:unnamed protein product [Caenorhabditis auriculariae]|uniref:Conserved oligomeric Golgi complex subunit 6 n=1 Tax=Caenorhabditis auriculariae TaxID=2777116 RepID=A0A8S1HKG8_9PELO|nr:unnamed protein product [Caenorhabditis auriculariae]